MEQVFHTFVIWGLKQYFRKRRIPCDLGGFILHWSHEQIKCSLVCYGSILGICLCGGRKEGDNSH